MIARLKYELRVLVLFLGLKLMSLGGRLPEKPPAERRETDLTSTAKLKRFTG